jgi:expansin (peptidoglycan-binding protein)
MQVVNANEPVSALEASTDGGSTWIATTRTSYNYFEYTSGFGTDTVDVRVTGSSGNTVIVENVSCSTTSEIIADSNL